MRFGRNGIRVADAAGTQILVQASFAKAPADEGPAARLGKLGVVYITKCSELFGQSCDIRRAFIIPPPFAGLTRQIAR